jgi:hypothetical protein
MIKYLIEDSLIRVSIAGAWHSIPKYKSSPVTDINYFVERGRKEAIFPHDWMQK